MPLYGKRERYDAAQEQIRLHRWEVNPKTGVIWSSHLVGPIGTERDGYLRVAVPCTDGRYRYVSAHRVVWEFFHGPSNLDLTINHLNGNTLDNRIDNLELISNAANALHGHRVLGRANQSRNRGASNPQAKLDAEKIMEIKRRQRNPYQGQGRDLAEEFGVSVQCISQIKNGWLWKDVEPI